MVKIKSEISDSRFPRWLSPWAMALVCVSVCSSLVTRHSLLPFAQQPQAQQGQPLYAANATYVNGVAPGYWPTAGSGLTLNLSAGTVMCHSVATNYPGGTLSMTASQTNYVSLNPSMGCAPFATTSAFATGQIPVAVVVAGPSAITSITDVRTWFSTLPAPADPQVVSVKDCGAYGDSIHDDTVAIQSCLNKFTNGLVSLGSGELFFPSGTYLISSPLYYMGDVGHAFRMVGISGDGGTSTGSVIACTGTGCATAMLFMMGLNNQSGIEKITFLGNSYANRSIWISSTNAVGGTITQAITTPGLQTVSIGSLDTSGGTLAAGSLLNVDSGANTEFIVLTAVASDHSTITANFSKTHAVNTLFGESSPSGSGTTIKDVEVSGITGAGSDGIRVGSTFGNETATITFDHVSVSGLGSSGPPAYGIRATGANNTEGFYVYGGNFTQMATGLSFLANEQVTVMDALFGGNGVDLNIGDEQAQITNVHSENSTQFINSTGAGGGLMISPIVCENCFWNGVAAASGSEADVVIDSGTNPLVIISSYFWNQRTGSSLPLIKTAGLQIYSASNPYNTTSFYSTGTWYANATGYVPLVTDIGGGPVPWFPLSPPWSLPSPLAVTSIGDMGGPAAQYTRLTNYFNSSILADSSCGTSQASQIAGTGLIRTCSGGLPIVFRNYAGNGDITALTTNSSDQVVLGGTAGAKTNGSFAIGSGNLSMPGVTIAGPTSPISAGTCTPEVRAAYGGATASSGVSWAISTPPASAGYAGLTVYVRPDVGGVNLSVCNPTASSITPAGVNFNVRVIN